MDAPLVRISVIIPTYGRPEFLADTIRSLAEQTFPPFEVIIVDDGSPIPVACISDTQLNVTTIRHARNQGQGAARNTGLAHATGDWILFLDDDDLLMPIRLETAVRDMGEARSHAMDFAELIGDEVRPDHTRRFQGDMRDYWLDRSHPLGRHPMMGQLIHRREDVVQFDPALRRRQDTEWWHRMRHAAIFAWSPGVGLQVRVHSTPRHGDSAQARYLASAVIALRFSDGVSRAMRAQLFGDAAGRGTKGTATRRCDSLGIAIDDYETNPPRSQATRLGVSSGSPVIKKSVTPGILFTSGGADGTRVRSVARS